MISFSVFVRDEEQLKIVKQYPVSMIYTDNLDLVQQDSSLYYEVSKSYNKNFPNNLLIRDVGLLQEFQGKKNIVIDYGLNVANMSSLSLYQSYFVKKIILSLEVSLEELKFFPHLKDYPVEIYLYGRPKVMILKNHPLFTHSSYELLDVKQGIYPVLVDENGLVFIYHKEPINRISSLKSYTLLGISNFRIDFFKESIEEIKFILDELFQA